MLRSTRGKKATNKIRKAIRKRIPSKFSGSMVTSICLDIRNDVLRAKVMMINRIVPVVTVSCLASFVMAISFSLTKVYDFYIFE